MYYNDNGQYPPALTAGASLATNSVVYMDIIPVPPKPTDNELCTGITLYTYTSRSLNGAPNSDYFIVFCLGAKIGNLCPGFASATPAGMLSYSLMPGGPPAKTLCNNETKASPPGAGGPPVGGPP